MADEEEDSGTRLIIPKHEADLEEIKAALGVYANIPDGDWLSNADYKKALEDILGSDQYASSYTKKSQVPAYYGFIEWQDYTKKTSDRRITSSGRSFLRAIEENDVNGLYRLLIESMESVSFGDDNYGSYTSHSVVNPPNVLLRAILSLGGLRLKEFAHLMWRMSEEDVPYAFALEEVRLLRKWHASPILHAKAEKWKDPKPITSLKKWGFLIDEDGLMKINSDVIAQYRNRIEVLPLYHPDLLEYLFVAWLKDNKYSQSLDNYPRSLKAISLPYPGKKNTSVFEGMVEYLQGTRPEVPFFRVVSEDKLKVYYGNFIQFIERKGNPDPADWDPVRYADCYDYALSASCTDKARLYNAYQAYKKFFKWWIANKKLYGFEEDTMFNGDLGPVQKIVYGAPGTGKSHGINDLIKNADGTDKYPVFRTTFHPDSDYSTFVGAYKPTMNAGKIEYTFRPQAFINAYVKAWEDTSKPVVLVIEEINRGNCAQIFGDLFQLLDRDDDGYSKYPITPDADLAGWLEGKVPDATMLKLPPNLYIWATMNTSDQSLFPIDSAFKRRWDWQYTPITDAGKGYQIKIKIKNGEVEEEETYDWWKFLEKVNKVILDTTKSEDKQMGYFFVRVKDGEGISSATFVNKVLFYLFYDVFKDWDLPVSLFKKDGSNDKYAFKDFFSAQGKVNDDAVVSFLDNLKLA